MVSAAYARCLAEASAHHASSKTYSGKLLRPHAPFIKEIVDRLGCRTVLDYGCGKGEQYRWVVDGLTLEDYWGVRVTKFDPAWPPYAAEPTGTFDLVICSHVLGSIPVVDLPEIIGRLRGFASKAVYVAEKIGPLKKKVFSDPSALPVRWSPRQWMDALGRIQGVEVTLATREKHGDDKVMTHHRRFGGAWVRI